jgi:hypothetical protein
MPASTRKTADATPADEAEAAVVPVAESEASVAEEAPAADAPASPSVEDFREPVMVVFNGQAQSAVAGVGLCDPGVAYLLPAAVADDVCRGGLFTLVESA